MDMRVFGIVGPGQAELAARLVPRLDGPVARIELADSVDHGEGVDSYRLGSDGSWRAAGSDWTVDALLDDVAPRYEHAVCLGGELSVPTITLGEATADDVLFEAPDADAVDIEDVLDALAGVEPHVTLGTLVSRIKASPRADRAGAIATFTGRVRAKDGDDDPRTTALEFEKYEGVAEERMATICRELEARAGVLDVEMHHRTGLIPDGEDIVFVVVLAGHREEAFRTVEDGINRLKDEVPLFKKEVTVEETFWRHER
jgi:molybdopterin synthase catalytic subunit